MEKITKTQIEEALTLGVRAFNKFSEQLYFSRGYGGSFDMHQKLEDDAFESLLHNGLLHENPHVRALAAATAHSKYEWERNDRLVVLNEQGEIDETFQPWDPPKDLAEKALTFEFAQEYPNHMVLNAWVQMAKDLPSKVVSKIVRGAPTSARINILDNPNIKLTEKQMEWNAKNKDERLASAYISKITHNPDPSFFDKIRWHSDSIRLAVYRNPHIQLNDDQIKKGLSDSYRTFNGMIDSYDYLWSGRFILESRPEIRERSDLILDTLRTTRSWEALKGMAEEFELKIQDSRNISGKELAIQYERKLLNERSQIPGDTKPTPTAL